MSNMQLTVQTSRYLLRHLALKNHIDVHHFAALKEEADGRVSV